MEKKTISAKIIADSKDNRGNRITTMKLEYPRFILSELNTHRMFSRNSASSRAIPFAKMVKDIEEDPFIPIAWQKDHKGMQGTEYVESHIAEYRTGQWLMARNAAVKYAKSLNSNSITDYGIEFPIVENKDGVTKQLCNRLLEPFQWMTTLVTATEYDNFFELRCPKYNLPVANYGTYNSWKDLSKDLSYPEVQNADLLFKLKNNTSQAEIHIQALAEAMWDAKNESEPVELKAGEWHIPFSDKIDYVALAKSSDVPQDFYDEECDPNEPYSGFYKDWLEKYVLKVATSRAARISYTTHDGEIDYEKDIKLHDDLLESRHASPFEHCAKMMSDEEYLSFTSGAIDIERDDDLDCQALVSIAIDDENKGWCRNFRGFIPYRHLVNL